MHSTEPCLSPGLPNIFPSLSNSSFYAVLPCLSVLQSHHLMKANQSIKTSIKSIMAFYQPSSHFMHILGPKILTTLVLNTLNFCPSLNSRYQDCNKNKCLVKLHTAFLNLCVCIQQTERKRVHFTLTE